VQGAVAGVLVCSGGTPNITNTDLIKVNLTGPVSLLINQVSGPFAPGFTNELGTTDEIELTFVDGQAVVWGTNANDHIRMGVGGINLNANEATDDVDVSGMSNVPLVDGRLGNDLITTRGGHGTGGAVDPFIALLGNDGNDRLLGAQIIYPPDPGLPDPGPFYDLIGGAGTDRLEGGSRADNLQGGDGDDYLDGGAGEDTLDGEDGVNTVAFLLANESVGVNLGANTATYEDYTESIPGFRHVIGSNKSDGLGGDTLANRLSGRGGDDVVIGGSGADQLFGEKGNDSMAGGPDLDQVVPGPGNDSVQGEEDGETFSGGTGRDQLRYVSTTMTSINLATGTATGPGVSDNFSSFEDAEVSGPATLTLTGTAGPNELLLGGGGGTINGGDGADAIDGSASTDTLNGQGGNDEIIPRAGDDTVNGGSGNDRLEGSSDDNTFIGGPGRDLIDYSRFGIGPLTIDLRITTPQVTGHGLDSFTGVENLISSFGADTLIGNSSANRLDGTFGDDWIRGDGGNDTIVGGQGDDQLEGGPGRDTALYTDATSGVNVRLNTTNSQDTNRGWDLLTQFENLTGSKFNDILRGNGMRNVLTGGRGHDQLFGLGGPDRLVGLAGNDDLWGGPGNDECIGGPGIDTLHSC
jgi:Ca2+-binding RTX toxin-like protein